MLPIRGVVLIALLDDSETEKSAISTNTSCRVIVEKYLNNDHVMNQVAQIHTFRDYF